MHDFPADSSTLTFQWLSCVSRLVRETDRCGESLHQHGLKGTDQYTTVNGRLADAAAQGLQSINCRLEGARRTKNLPFAFLT